MNELFLWCRTCLTARHAATLPRQLFHMMRLERRAAIATTAVLPDVAGMADYRSGAQTCLEEVLAVFADMLLCQSSSSSPPPPHHHQLI